MKTTRLTTVVRSSVVLLTLTFGTTAAVETGLATETGVPSQYSDSGGNRHLSLESACPDSARPVFAPNSGEQDITGDDCAQHGGLDKSFDEVAYLASPLVLAPPDPGIAGVPNTFTVTNAVPGEKIYFIYGRVPGSTPVPGCSGLEVDIWNPKLTAFAIADANGVASFTGRVTPQAQNKTVLLQAASVENCAKSNRVDWTFL